MLLGLSSNGFTKSSSYPCGLLRLLLYRLESVLSLALTPVREGLVTRISGAGPSPRVSDDDDDDDAFDGDRPLGLYSPSFSSSSYSFIVDRLRKSANEGNLTFSPSVDDSGGGVPALGVIRPGEVMPGVRFPGVTAPGVAAAPRRVTFSAKLMVGLGLAEDLRLSGAVGGAGGAAGAPWPCSTVAFFHGALLKKVCISSIRVTLADIDRRKIAGHRAVYLMGASLNFAVEVAL